MERMAFDPQNPILVNFLVKHPFFHLLCPSIFTWEMVNQVMDPFRSKKVKVSLEKMGPPT